MLKNQFAADLYQHSTAKLFTLFLLFGLIVLLSACEKQQPKPITVIDLSQIEEPQDEGLSESDLGELDSEIIEDMDHSDLSLDLGLDLGSDRTPLAQPKVIERAFVETAQNIIVAWRDEQQILKVTLEKSEIDQEAFIAEAVEWITLPDGFQALDEIEIKGLASRPPYFIVSGQGVESFAIRADLDETEVEFLGLTETAFVAVDSESAIVLAKAWQAPQQDQSEAESAEAESAVEQVESPDTHVAWRFVREGQWSAIEEDQIGLPAISSLSRGLGSWIVGSESGLCFMLNERIGLHDAWKCHSSKKSAFLSDDFELKVFGPLLRSSEDAPRGRGLWMWSGTPGRSGEPLFSEIVLSNTESLSHLREDQALTLVDGFLSRWLVQDGKQVQALIEQEDQQWTILTHRGQYQFSHSFSEHIFALVDLVSPSPVLLNWDEQEAGLQVRRIDSEEWKIIDLPSVAHEDELCVVSPERCDEIDHDCDGQIQNQRCCLSGEVVTSRTPEVLFPKLNWFTGDSEIGALALIASQNTARLFSFSTAGGEATLRSQWNEVEQITHFSNYLSLVSATAITSDGQALLLQNKRVNDQWFSKVLPCEPHAVQVLNAEHKTRVYCEDKALILDDDQEDFIEETYPDEGLLQWMTPWFTGQETLGERYWLVALGEHHQLSLWHDEVEQITQGESDSLYLPNHLGQLSALDRSLPIQLPALGDGLLSRLNEQHRVEVWFDDLGWSPIGGHRWPLWSSLAEREAIAITVGYNEDPQEVQDSFLQRVNVRVHPLKASKVFFGELIKSGISKDSFGGSHLADYNDQDGTRPNLINLVAGSLELSYLLCHD